MTLPHPPSKKSPLFTSQPFRLTASHHSPRVSPSYTPNFSKFLTSCLCSPFSTNSGAKGQTGVSGLFILLFIPNSSLFVTSGEMGRLSRPQPSFSAELKSPGIPPGECVSSPSHPRLFLGAWYHVKQTPSHPTPDLFSCAEGRGYRLWRGLVVSHSLLFCISGLQQYLLVTVVAPKPPLLLMQFGRKGLCFQG